MRSVAAVTKFPPCIGWLKKRFDRQRCDFRFGSPSARTDTVVLACTHYPLLMDRLVALAPWKVDWIDPAPAIARRVADLLGPPGTEADLAGAEMIFTSGRPHTLSRALMPFFGGRVPA